MEVTYKSGLSGTANSYAQTTTKKGQDDMVIDIELFTEPNSDSDEWCATSCGYCSNDEIGNGENTYVIINSSDLVCNSQRCKADMLEDMMAAEKIHDDESGIYITASGQGYDSCCEYEHTNDCCEVR